MRFNRKVLIIALIAFSISSGQAVYSQGPESGCYGLSAKWSGEFRSSNARSDGANNRLPVAISGVAKDGSGNNLPVEYKQVLLQGFQINFDATIEEREDISQALDALDEDLEYIAGLVDENQFELFKKVPIWIEIKRQEGKSAMYLKGATKDWLAANGYPLGAAKSIEIVNAKNYFNWRNANQPLLILHEMTHAYHDQHLSPELKEAVTAAYNNALQGKKYDNVAYSTGGTKRAYALTSDYEYLAEITEAYFGKNDFYPFNRKDLEEFDPEGYELMLAIWE